MFIGCWFHAVLYNTVVLQYVGVGPMASPLTVLWQTPLTLPFVYLQYTARVAKSSETTGKSLHIFFIPEIYSYACTTNFLDQKGGQFDVFV